MRTFALIVALAGILAAVTVAVIGCADRANGRHLPPAGAVPIGSPAMSYSFGGGGQRDMPAEPGSLPSPHEELWIIQRPSNPRRAAQCPDDVPGTGALVTDLPGRETPVPVPLEHTDVRASIAGFLATTDVVQTFHNPFDTKIEAVYVFPLPENAAVSEFVMSIGERRIRGIIRERREAERIYHEARAAGHVASLLTQERPNIFTQSVANIEPGKRIDVSIRYYHTLAYDDGDLEYVFPMVVGPRFNPSGFTGGIGAVARGDRGVSGQNVEVQYLQPGERSGHDVSLAVEFAGGLEIEEVMSRSHQIEVVRDGPRIAGVRLSAADTIPNKDFVLRCRVAGDAIKPALIAHRTPSGDGYFTLLLVPPADLADRPRRPMEMVFVLDCSGSMYGRPLAQAKAAVRHALSRLAPGDTFQVIQFSNAASAMGPAPVPATRDNVRAAQRYLDSLNGEGGTMMIEGIRAALQFPHDPERLRIVTFLTDGYIGNETEILSEMRRLLGPSRVFSFGVGSSPNRYLMDRMAKLGAGAVAYLGLNDDGADVMDRFFTRASRPALTDIEIDWGAMGVHEVFPASPAGRVPDLFVGRPVVLAGRFTGSLPDRIVIRGRANGRMVELEAPVHTAHGAAALAQIWARHKIADLADRAAAGEAADIAPQVREIALTYGIMSAFTAFVAADTTTVTAGDHGVTVAVPVPVPDGVRYETTVTERANVAGDVN